MERLARGLHVISGGRITPNMVTITGLLAHIVIAFCIARGQLALAALLLVIFGLFDALDGSLARLQKIAGPGGMLLDASTDRMKEVMLYMGAAYYLIENPVNNISLGLIALVVVGACGGSLLVSYVKAKGETAVHDKKLSANEINRLFQDGLMRYEVRMAALVIGLLANGLLVAIFAIMILSWYTASTRLVAIYRKLTSS